MNAIIGILQYAASFLGGLAARLGVVLLAMAAMLVPALVVEQAGGAARGDVAGQQRHESKQDFCGIGNISFQVPSAA